VGSYQLDAGKQFCGSFVGARHAVGVALSGDFFACWRIMHGCTPLDGIYHTITRAEGSIIYELDGRPIPDIMDDLFGHRDWRDQRPIDYLTVGVNYGERYGVPEESDYVNRLLIGALPDGSGVSMFEPGLEEGMEIQFMLRDTKTMVESAAKNSRELIEEIGKAGKRPAFALYIDCAGRTMQYSGSMQEESEEIRKICNEHQIPLLGLFTGVEIAPLRGWSRGLDWTGVLVVAAEDN
jgi:small ligand-binding sensory domain FIST